MQRREFLVRSAWTACVLPAAGSMPASAAAPRSALHVLVDTRFAASLDFGAAAARDGARIARFAGDLTALWRDDLQHRWRATHGAMTGVTTDRALLCLEQLAGDHRWRVGTRRELDGGLVHWTLGRVS